MIKGGDILYSNHSLIKMLEIKNYNQESDQFFDDLRKQLRAIKVSKLGKDFTKEISVWDFLESKETGAVFQIQYEDQLLELKKKYISMNKVTVNVNGTNEKLFVVRDLSSMVHLQKIGFMKQHLSRFTEKIVRQIQEATEISSINLQRLENFIQSPGKPISEDILNELRHILFRIRDFSQVYAVIESTFTKTEANFSLADEFKNVKDIFKSDFKKTNTKFKITTDPAIPKKVRASQ